MILKSPDISLVSFKVMGICRRCKHYHKVEGITPDLFGRAAFDWEAKHRHCELEKPGSVEFLSPSRFVPKGFDDRVYEEAGIGPQFLDWLANADVKIAYAANAAIAMDLSALAASPTWVAGREGGSINNTSNKYLDYRISGQYISGTTPAVNTEARLYYIAPTEDTPAWPDVFDGTDSAETVSKTQILDTLILGWSGLVSADTNITWPATGALTIAQAFGIVPSAFGFFFSHAQTAALKTDAGNTNSFYAKGIYATVI